MTVLRWSLAALLVAGCGGGGTPDVDSGTPVDTGTMPVDMGSMPVDMGTVPSCSFSSCGGCCSGTTCLGGTSASACGTGGAACVDCGPSFLCDTSSACVVDPASRWNVVLDALTIPAVGCGGIVWDSSIGTTPDEGDPFVNVFVGNPTSTPSMSSTSSDTSFVTFSPPEAVATNQRADDLQTYLGFSVFDDDSPGTNDPVGGVGVSTATVTAAFGGAPQTANAADNCTTGHTPGWGPLNWHLERF